MSINTETCSKKICKKQPFQIKAQSNRLPILKVHHTNYLTKQSIRFLNASFNATGDQLAACNHLGNMYVFDFSMSKYWLMAHLSCSVLKYTISESHKELLLAGSNAGPIHIYNSSTGRLIADLLGHKYAVTDISYSNHKHCLTVSTSEAIIWSLDNFTKIQVLQLDEGVSIKLIMFIPMCNNILACFQDESIQVWQGNNFTAIKQIVPKNCAGAFSRLTIRSIAFPSSGKEMAIVGNSPNIFVFHVDTLELKTEIRSNDAQVQMKKVAFIPIADRQSIVILTNTGILLFFDMHHARLLDKFTPDDEIWKFALDPTGNRIALLCRDGDILLYSVNSLTVPTTKKMTRVKIKSKKKTVPKSFKQVTPKVVTDKINEILDVRKLKAILKEFGEYPSIYRKIIWAHILELPNDASQYDLILNTNYKNSFQDFEKSYPLTVKQDRKNLKCLLINLVSWCPFLSSVNYLPTLVFPFVKYLQAEPIVCFELSMTILVNYCQHWFEYHPVPPLNILGMVESILIQQDYELFDHFEKRYISSEIYAWNLLQSMFSEVFISTDWLIFCDHLLSNDPAFLIIAAAAFCITNRTPILRLEHRDDFECFFHTNNSLDFKRFISRCYTLLDNQSLEHHPSLYLQTYKPFENGVYPMMVHFPKNCLEVCESIKALRSEAIALSQEERVVREKNVEIEKIMDFQRGSIEYFRQIELKRLYDEKLNEEAQRVDYHRQRLNVVQQEMQEREREVVNQMPFRISRSNSQTSMPSIEKETSGNLEQTLLVHYSNLLKLRVHIESPVDDDKSLDMVELNKIYKKIASQLQKGQSNQTLPSPAYLKQINMAAGLAAVNSLMKKVEENLSSTKTSFHEPSTKQMVSRLKFKYEELSTELSRMLSLSTEYS